MYIKKTGYNSIDDDDVEYLNSGRFVLSVDAERIHHLLVNAIISCPDFFDTELFKEILSIHSHKENYGDCCNIRYVSNNKATVCNSCGNIVRLT